MPQVSNRLPVQQHECPENHTDIFMQILWCAVSRNSVYPEITSEWVEIQTQSKSLSLRRILT